MAYEAAVALLRLAAHAVREADQALANDQSVGLAEYNRLSARLNLVALGELEELATEIEERELVG